MRKIYFIIFGVALVILILLVDWREKFNALTGKKELPALPFGRVDTGESAALSAAAPDSLLEAPFPAEMDEVEALTGDLSEAELDPAALPPSRFPSSLRPSLRPASSLASRRSGGGLPSSQLGRAATPKFEDVPEQPYVDESRQLLRQTMRNYDRIMAPKTPNPDRQP